MDGAVVPVNGPAPATHTKLPDTRKGTTHKFSVNGSEGYITFNLYDDGRPGEMFIVMAKEGSTLSGLMDVLATTASIALQHGVPLTTIIKKWQNQKFEPSGFTKHPDIKVAKSFVDYLARWMAIRFVTEEERKAANISLFNGDSHHASTEIGATCKECGGMLVQNDDALRCNNCNHTESLPDQLPHK